MPCRVIRPGSPGPAPQSQTQPGSSTGQLPSGSVSESVMPLYAVDRGAGKGCKRPAMCAGATYCGRRLPIGPGFDYPYSPPRMNRKPDKELRRGWTTGACATAATRAALMILWGEGIPRKTRITLPRGERPEFLISHVDQG